MNASLSLSKLNYICNILCDTGSSQYYISIAIKTKLEQSGTTLTKVPPQDISIAKKGLQIQSEGLEVNIYLKFSLCGKHFYIRTNALLFDGEHDFVISNKLAKSSGLLQYYQIPNSLSSFIINIYTHTYIVHA